MATGKQAEYNNGRLEVAPLNPVLLLPGVLLGHETRNLLKESFKGEDYLVKLLEAFGEG